MGRWGVALGPQVLKQVHERVVKVAQAKGVTTGRRMRVDTTVVETNVHHPTDSTLLGDGVRVLIRTIKKITQIAGAVGTKLRDRSRSVKFRLLEIGRVARAKGAIDQDKLTRRYGALLDATSRVVGQAKRFSNEIAQGVKRATSVLKQLALDGLRQQLDEMVPLVRQVMKQTRARIFRGNTRSEGKLLSLFEPSTEVIRKGKAGKPNEFGKMVKLQEAENQIIIDYEVYARRPNDSDLLVPAIETHQALLGRAPHLAAADAAFYSAKNEAAAKARGVKRVCIPNHSTKSPERKREQKNAGSVTARNGAPDPRAASASQNGDMASAAATTRAMSVCSAGSASASSLTISSTSGAQWKGWPPRKSARPSSSLTTPPAIPAGFALSESTDHNAAKPQFCAGK